MAEIEAPISLVGLGRSGTTLIEHAFASAPSVFAAGETLGIALGSYSGAMDSFFDSKFCDYDSREKFAASVVKKLFSSLFPIESPEYKHWFQKPAGIPKFVDWSRYRTENDRGEFPTTWFWGVFKEIFPKGRYLTVLRNPWDVVRSRKVFSGWDEDGGWEDVLNFYDFLNFNLSNTVVVFYDDILANPIATLRKLFDLFEIEICEQSLISVTNKSYVPTYPTLDCSGQKNMVKGPKYSFQDVALISGVWEKFGMEFLSPSGNAYFDIGQ